MSNCSDYYTLGWVTLVFLPVWIYIAVTWGCFVFVPRSRRGLVVPFHRMMMMPPVLRASVCLVSFTTWMMCPSFHQLSAQMLSLLLTCLWTLWKTLFLSCYLLIGEGVCVTRLLSLEGVDALRVSLSIGSIYVLTAVSQIVTNTIWNIPITCVIHLFWLVIVFISSSNTLNSIREKETHLINLTTHAYTQLNTHTHTHTN
eukprot:GHVR01179132.1.p1 GENE.GHVR01179132.1~~GHVR01179132.1.p1  ORF type:complete len:207 (-),score=32.45 GHVR01179132.1:57-656(-)